MISKRLFILALAIISLLAAQVFAEEEQEDIEAVKSVIDAPDNFNISVEAEGKEGLYPIVSDDKITFIISKPDGQEKDSSYKLYYFLDGRVRRVIEGISLPYKFTRTYRGQIEGSYRVSFVLKDPEGKYGSATISIVVEHK